MLVGEKNIRSSIVYQVSHAAYLSKHLRVIHRAPFKRGSPRFKGDNISRNDATGPQNGKFLGINRWPFRAGPIISCTNYSATTLTQARFAARKLVHKLFWYSLGDCQMKMIRWYYINLPGKNCHFQSSSKISIISAAINLPHSIMYFSLQPLSFLLLSSPSFASFTKVPRARCARQPTATAFKCSGYCLLVHDTL